LSGRGLCDELITRPEESYRLCCVVVCDLETSRMGAPCIYNISHLRVNFVCLSQGIENSFLQGKVINKISGILDLIFSFPYTYLELEDGLKANHPSLSTWVSSVHYGCTSLAVQGCYKALVTDVSDRPIRPVFQGRNLKGPLKIGSLGCPIASVINYQHRPRNITEQRRSWLHRTEAWYLACRTFP